MPYQFSSTGVTPYIQVEEFEGERPSTAMGSQNVYQIVMINSHDQNLHNDSQSFFR